MMEMMTMITTPSTSGSPPLDAGLADIRTTARAFQITLRVTCGLDLGSENIPYLRRGNTNDTTYVYIPAATNTHFF